MSSTQAILEKQRAKSKIDPTELAHLVYRGKERFQFVQNILNEAVKIGVVTAPEIYEMNRNEAFTHAQKAVAKLRMHTDIDVFSEENSAEEFFVATNFHSPGSVGAVMSSNIIKIMGTDEQVSQWYTKLAKNIWLCCYAQTELSTGSDVQNLNTLAVFDPKTKEFEFHNPTIASVKWWPGELGVACSHAVVFARLISNGKDHGVQAFFVQIRDPITHKLEAGVEVGDIGPKLGYKTKDNGYLKFSRHRTSKNALLGRYIQIDDEGKVSRSGNPKRMYTAMMRTRSVLLVMAYSSIFKAVTIATRYSLVRTQFNDSKGRPIPIYEYQMQREKLFRELARVYVQNLSTSIAFSQIQKNNELSKKDDYSELQSTHVMLCSFKAMFTYWQSESIANLIKACGGHGYSHYSGLPHILIEEFPNQILEGENSVLLLQASRYLVKCWFRLKKNNTKKIQGFFRFLLDLETCMGFKLPSAELPCPESFALAFRAATCYLLNKVCLKMVGHMEQEKDAKKIWDTLVANDNQRLAKVFSVQLILECCWTKIQTIKSLEIKKAVTKLFTLACINLVDEHGTSLFEAGVITSAQVSNLLKQKDAILDELKDDGLVLAEAMQWDDAHLGSAIATKDKDPYETLYDWAKQHGQMNQFEGSIHPSVTDYQLKVSRLREQKL